MIEDSQRGTPYQPDTVELRVLESCAFTWIFDGGTFLFRRLPRDAYVSLHIPTAWIPYHRLEIDDFKSCFVVALNEAGTRTLRAWRHTDPCERCQASQRTVGEAQQHIQWWRDWLNVVDRRSTVARLGRNQLLRPFGGWLGTERAS